MATAWTINLKPCEGKEGSGGWIQCGENLADLKTIPHPEGKRNEDGSLRQIWGYKCRNCGKIRRIPKKHPTKDEPNRNPAKKSRGLPHQDPQLTQMSGIFEQQFDVARAQMSGKEEYLPEGEIQETVIQKHKDKAKVKARQDEIASLSIPVDFTRHIENLTHFKYDLEGFLEAVKNKYGEDEVAKKIFEQYKVVNGYLQLLIKSLKKLD